MLIVLLLAFALVAVAVAWLHAYHSIAQEATFALQPVRVKRQRRR